MDAGLVTELDGKPFQKQFLSMGAMVYLCIFIDLFIDLFFNQIDPNF